MKFQLRRAALVGLFLTTAACASAPASDPVPLVQPGAPGQPARAIAPAVSADLGYVRFTREDVQFMQGMIGHHQQAVEMTAMLATHTENAEMKLLGQRISLSQSDELSLMRRWLEVRGQAVPDEHAMHMHGATLMPGMLTAEEMQRLDAARGPQFDRLFLEGMIKHHGGALAMVDELFRSEGGGQESDIHAFATDVEADQRMEIARMAAMLEERMK